MKSWKRLGIRPMLILTGRFTTKTSRLSSIRLVESWRGMTWAIRTWKAWWWLSETPIKDVSMKMMIFLLNMLSVNFHQVTKKQSWWFRWKKTVLSGAQKLGLHQLSDPHTALYEKSLSKHRSMPIIIDGSLSIDSHHTAAYADRSGSVAQVVRAERS